jgi:hypothetical protein
MFLKPTASVPSTVQELSVPLDGVPRTGVTNVGLVNVGLVKDRPLIEVVVFPK